MLRTIIETKKVEKIYYTGAGPLPVLHGIDFKINEGEFVAVMGPSGSGKSTFMNILGCLDDFNSGSYLLLNTPIGKLGGDQLAELRNKFIGFVFQGYNLLSRSDLVDNVALPLLYAKVPTAERRFRAIEMLDKVGLKSFSHHRPNQISGGQQQRVAIARALVGKPKLMLADEPTGNLDSQTTIDIMKLFCTLNDEGLTIVLVTHEPEVSQFAKRIIFFKDGNLVNDEQVKNRRWK